MSNNIKEMHIDIFLAGGGLKHDELNDTQETINREWSNLILT